MKRGAHILECHIAWRATHKRKTDNNISPLCNVFFRIFMFSVTSASMS